MVETRFDYLLPIGSIIKVKGIGQKLMITGVLQTSASHPEYTFDYVSVPYPEGMHDAKLNVGVDHSEIEEVVFRGYEDKERRAFIILLEGMYRRATGEQ